VAFLKSTQFAGVHVQGQDVHDRPFTATCGAQNIDTYRHGSKFVNGDQTYNPARSYMVNWIYSDVGIAVKETEIKSRQNSLPVDEDTA